MWICDEEIGSRCGKDDDIILRILRVTLQMVSPIRLANTRMQRIGGRETGVTHSDDPVNCKGNEVEELGRFFLRVQKGELA